MSNAYGIEESIFKKKVEMIPVSEVPKSANIITSHFIYKVKRNDDNTLKMNARIATHGNKDKDMFNLKIDSSTCPPTGIRILLSIATMFK